MNKDVEVSEGLFDNDPFTIRKVPFYNDEPKIFQYVADYNGINKKNEKTRGYGTDFQREVAVDKALYEAIERVSLGFYNQTNLTKEIAKNLRSPFISPFDLQHFTPNQLKSKNFSSMQLKEDSTFLWAKGFNFLTRDVTFIPAQIILFPYLITEELIIRFPSTSGSACGRSIIEASCRAVLEVVERDAFMCWYLTETPAKKIDVKSSVLGEDLENVYSLFERYKLELQLLVLPSQWVDYPIVLAVIIDSSGIGPELTTGLKCHPNLKVAIKGAISEAQQKRPWLRDYLFLYGFPTSKRNRQVCDSWSRALFWATPGQQRHISFLWDNVDFLQLEEACEGKRINESLNWEKVWKVIISTAKEKNFDLVIVDMSNELSKNFKVNIVKAVIPQLHSIYMNEQFQYLQSISLKKAFDSFGSRWSKNSKNKLDIKPHFFW